MSVRDRRARPRRRTGGIVVVLGAMAGLVGVLAEDLGRPDETAGPWAANRASAARTGATPDATAGRHGVDPAPSRAQREAAAREVLRRGRPSREPRSGAGREVRASTEPLEVDDPDWLVTALSELDVATASARADRILTLLGHPDPEVRSAASVAVLPLRERPEVLEALAVRYAVETDLWVRVDIAETWKGRIPVGPGAKRRWQMATKFLERLWHGSREPESRWSVLDAYATLGRDYPAPAIERLEVILAAGYPDGDPPAWTVEGLRSVLSDIREHGTIDP